MEADCYYSLVHTHSNDGSLPCLMIGNGHVDYVLACVYAKYLVNPVAIVHTSWGGGNSYLLLESKNCHIPFAY